MPAPHALADHDFHGMLLTVAAQKLGQPDHQARIWLTKHGYRIPHDTVRRIDHPTDIQDRIAARVATAPPSAPCFRCGARVGCEHRG